MSDPATVRVRLTARLRATPAGDKLREQAQATQDRTTRQQLLAAARTVDQQETRKLKIEGKTVSLTVEETRVVPLAKVPDEETLRTWRTAGIAVEVERLCALALPADFPLPELHVGPTTLRRPVAEEEPEAVKLWLQDHDIRELERRGLECRVPTPPGKTKKEASK